jgi:hypothetical protein
MTEFSSKKYAQYNSDFLEEVDKALHDEPNSFLTRACDLKHRFQNNPDAINAMIDDVYSYYYDACDQLNIRKDALVAFLKGISLEAQSKESEKEQTQNQV